MADKFVQIQVMNPMMVAPCGLNCSLCRAYLRKRKPCPGCRGGDSHKSNASLACAIRNCKELAAGGHQFCCCCNNFPCAELLHLDARYQAKYGVSVIANLERIRAVGAERFIAEETAKWSRAKCGSMLCVHKPLCPNCGHTSQGS
jgi:hypothetical protein